jgi:cyclophilin family peptidyl-prolyl cis-trans isomerase
MRRLTLALTAVLVSSSLAYAGGAAPAGTSARTAPAAPQAVVLQTTLGDIVIRLADKDAPLTCANFVAKVKTGFYDGTCFHRVIAGFMIQGGDPNSRDADPANDGMGGPTTTVPAEIKLPHVRGAVATARQGDQVNPKRASSSCQFFIDLAPQASLDRGGYTVFGQVVSGMDVVDRIAAFASDATLPAANGGGRNPGKKAMIRKAFLAPLSQYTK